ncbi:MAG: glycosyltransferase [Pirellulaceae bacterium]
MARICFICISLRAGGTERVVTHLANAFCTDHEVSVIIVQDGEPFYELDQRVNLFPKKGRTIAQRKWKRALAMMGHIRSSVRRLQPDVILSFGELISPIARLATLGTGARFVIFNRESPLRSIRGSAGIVNPLTYPLANLVVTQTETARRTLQARYRFSRFHIIPNPVNLPTEVPPMESRAWQIISVGYLGGEKNQQALLRAFAAASNRDEWKLAIVGDGPNREILYQLSRDLGIEKRVKFLGEREDVPALLSNSRIFAFTSLSEGFPNALSEGLAHGCACIAFDCVAGPSDLILHDRNGMLVPVDDQEAYSSALEALMSSESMQKRYSESARREIKRFSKDRVFQQYSQVIFECKTDGAACDS